MATTINLVSIYQQTLATLDQKVSELQEKFRNQIQCKNGCASCCKNARFRIRLIEAQGLLDAYKQASPEIQSAIQNNLFSPAIGNELDCPMLVSGSCTLYSARPALCRAYGILIRLNQNTSTCKLNFNTIPSDLNLEILEIEPYYEVLDELSTRIWQQSPFTQDSPPPVFTIREFFSGKLSNTQ